jgi:hypothetical protein
MVDCRCSDGGGEFWKFLRDQIRRFSNKVGVRDRAQVVGYRRNS